MKILKNSLFFFLLLAKTTIATSSVSLGIDVLEESQFALLRGKRVGLLTHPAGVNSKGQSTLKILHQSRAVHLVSLFGPEHGIYGNERAEVPIDNQIDPTTHLPVYSLYGKYRKPTPAMLHSIDVMVIDLQDIGVRSYTYVSCMRLTIEACFEQGKEVIVLDRPNPLGSKVDGPLLDENLRSYVGAFPIPYLHGLTIGEMALMSKAIPGWLKISDKVRKRGKLTVVPMKGWHRTPWPDTGLKWVPTSPNIPDLSAVLGYAITGLGTQIGGFRHGLNTPWPFRLLTYPGKSPEEIVEALQQKEIPGLDYKIVSFKEKGQERQGVFILISDWEKLRPTELSFYLMCLVCQWRDNPFAKASGGEKRLFNLHVGSEAWWREIEKRGSSARVKDFVEKWVVDAKRFQEKSRVYWLYK